MNRSEMSSEEPRDRLSELPDSLIIEIFGLLPIKEVVQTTILSKRWNNLWTTTPYLDFNGHTSEFVNHALTLWKGFKILKFGFRGGSVLNKSMFCDIDVWLRFVMENGIENLCLQLYSENDEVYSLPHNLYSCASLKVLYLSGCRLQINGNVHWNQLKSLWIEECDVDELSIYQVVCGSPLLEVFDLNLLNSDASLYIHSSSLKHLVVDRNFDDVKPSIFTEMRIWSPNLETLRLGGVPYDEYSLRNVSSLTDVSLDFFYEYCMGNILEDIFWQIFPATRHVEKVRLTDWCIKGIGALNKEFIISPLLNFKFLTVDNSYVNYEEIVDLLQIFPKLETLVLESDYYACHPGEHATSFIPVERNLPESFLLQLRTVEIFYIDGDSLIFPFIETLLKHASKLQEMVIQVRGLDPLMPLMPSCLAAIQQKVLRMPISSPTAELIFSEY